MQERTVVQKLPPPPPPFHLHQFMKFNPLESSQDLGLFRHVADGGDLNGCCSDEKFHESFQGKRAGARNQTIVTLRKFFVVWMTWETFVESEKPGCFHWQAVDVTHLIEVVHP